MADPSDVIRRFEERHKALDQAPGDGPMWHDGSDAAALLAVWWHVEPLVFNGGWPSVYYNGAGWAVPLAVRGYRRLGMLAAAERCELAARMVEGIQAEHPGHDYTSGTCLSSTLMEAVGDAGWDRLDDGWSEITEGTAGALVKYIEATQLADR